MCRGAGVGRNVDGGDEGGGDGVGLQREMGLVSGISLIVGRPLLFVNLPFLFQYITPIEKNIKRGAFSKIFLVRNNCRIRNLADCRSGHVVFRVRKLLNQISG